MTIPKIIHNIWIQGYEHLPVDIREKHLRIKKMNPDWDFIIWDEKMIIETLKKYPKVHKIFKNINSYSGFIGNMASKSDIARYVIMKEYGGLYYDMDFDCISPLDELFQSQSSSTPAVYIASSKIELLDYVYPFNKPKYCACFMAFEKEHPVWEKVFKKIKQAKNKYDIGSALDRTLQENENTYEIVNLEKVNGHYSCLSKNKICYTQVESSWNIFRPFIRYMNCYYKQLFLVVLMFIIIWGVHYLNNYNNQLTLLMHSIERGKRERKNKK
jgi:hypothetical protein